MRSLLYSNLAPAWGEISDVSQQSDDVEKYAPTKLGEFVVQTIFNPEFNVAVLLRTSQEHLCGIGATAPVSRRLVGSHTKVAQIP